ncbi:Uncharacterised protein [Bordetella pertussis]|nr:Uncharacterised protein [Bordetella pertussis]
MTANARRSPFLISGRDGPMLLQRNSNCPPLASVNNCCVPLYGTSTMSMPASCFSASSTRCGEVPMPVWPNAGLRPFPRPASSSCASVRASDACVAITTEATPPSMEMGSKSVRG